MHDDAVAAIGLSDISVDPELDLNNAAPVIHELGANPDPTVTLTGLYATGTTLKEDTDLTDAAADTGVETGPGVAVSTGDLTGGLVYPALIHASLSTDREHARAGPAKLSLPAELDADARRCVTSLIAIDTTSGGAATRAITTVKRVLGPETIPSGPFETVGGFTNVLDATVRGSPGTVVALAFGRDIHGATLNA